MRTSIQKPTQFQKQQPLARVDSGRSPLRRTYFRLRQIKQSTNQPKPPALHPPKHHSDFYSHQRAALQPQRSSKIQIKQKKLSNTASNFYSNMSRINKMSSISPRRDSSPMTKTFYSKKSNDLSPQKSQMSGNLLFGRTSLNFHKQDIWKNQNNNNYLNKYKIIKELGKGSFSTVFLARKQENNQSAQRNSNSPLKLNPQNEESRGLDASTESPMLKKNQSLNARSIEEDTLPCLANKAEKQGQQSNLVAIKVYQKFKMNKDPHKFKNIRKQINIMQNLENDGVVKLYESVETLTKISLVVQYGGQQSLLEYVKHNYPLPLEKVKDISFQLIKGISYLHQKNIVHRDIKLQNVLINNGIIKLIDFGFSCLTHKSQKMTVICGTPNYMAPQVISRKQYIGEQADIWSYGVVVYALAEGRHPFKAQSYNQLERIVNRGKFQFKKVKDQPFMDFVKRILRLKGSQRPSAVDIMNMKWMRQQIQN